MTDTSRNNDKELAAMCIELAKVTKNLQDLLENSSGGSRTDVAVARLEHQEMEDVVLVCDIKLVSRQQIIASIRSENSLPGALEPHMLGASHGNFCNMLEAVITNPLVSSFQAFLAKKAKTFKAEKDTVQMISGMGDHDFTGLMDED